MLLGLPAKTNKQTNKKQQPKRRKETKQLIKQTKTNKNKTQQRTNKQKTNNNNTTTPTTTTTKWNIELLVHGGQLGRICWAREELAATAARGPTVDSCWGDRSGVKSPRRPWLEPTHRPAL